MNRTVQIPKFLYEFHGDSPTVIGLILTYIAGLIAGVLGGLAVYNSGIELWKAVLAGLLFFDVAGGVVSNFTRSTNRYHRQSQKRRAAFLAIHILHPLLMAFIVNAYWAFFILLGVYTITCGFLIGWIDNHKLQYIFAGALTVIGVATLSTFNFDQSAPYVFGVLFMIKILIGFSVRRA